LRALLALAVVAGILAAPAAGSNMAARWFVTPGRNVGCELGLDRHGVGPVAYVFCLAYRAGSP
jgi:hypothetical protein